MLRCAISENSAEIGGGIYNDGDGVTLTNTIVSANYAQCSAVNFYGTLSDPSGYNSLDGYFPGFNVH